eukprot:23511_1
MNNNSNDKLFKQPIYHQAQYMTAAPPSPQHPPIHYIDPQYVQPLRQQYNTFIPPTAQRKSYLQTNQYASPQKSTSLDDILSAANSIHQYPTPSVTPDSSLGAMHAHSPYRHNIIDNHSAHSTPSNLLPSIKYYSNQHSNTSANSNSTYLSSTCTTTNASLQSSLTSQGYSDRHSMPHFEIAPQSHSHGQSDIQMAIHYHPYDAPSYHHQYSHEHASYPQMIPRSSTPNINIMELDQMNDSVMGKMYDEKNKKSSTDSLPQPVPHTFETVHSNAAVAVGMSSHQRTTTKQLELKHFGGEVRAYNIWIGCIQTNINAAFFYGLYPKLCEYFMDITGSPRCPTTNDLQSAFMVHGAEANKYKNDENTYLSIDKANFVSFWKWFKASCLIVKELRYLWDHSNANHHPMHSNKRKCVHYGLGLNFFCQRSKCEIHLLQSAEGTFTLRLSASVSGGVVLSYVEHHYMDINHKKICKHVILIRQRDGMYLCNKKRLSLHDIIRNFVKLKYLYTPNRPILKNKIF